MKYLLKCYEVYCAFIVQKGGYITRIYRSVNTKYRGLGWRSALLVGGSRDRSPVTGDFFWSIRQFHVPWRSTQPLKMSTRILLGVKTAGA